MVKKHRSVEGVLTSKARLFLPTQVARSRVTDDMDGTDGVADILHSYSSTKTLN